jgi:TPR repeat protein
MSIGSKINHKSALIFTGSASDQSQSREREKDLQIGIYYLRSALEKGVAEAGFQLARLYEQAWLCRSCVVAV